MLEREGFWESPESGSQQELLEIVPELSRIASVKTVIPYTQDSAELSLENMNQLSRTIVENREVYDGFVVIHGTDTMAYSASALSFILRGIGKPIIFTGSQRPFMQVRTDAKSNLINAVDIATKDFSEVAIFFGNKLLRGNRATKASTWKFEAFESPNFPLLGEAGLNINLNLYDVNNHGLTQQGYQPGYFLHVSVSVIYIFPGLNIDHLSLLLNSDIQAFIIIAYGAGNVSTNQRNGVLTFIEKAISMGKYVAINTQCQHGTVILDVYESARKLKKLGVLSCKDMTLEASITKMMFLLSMNSDKEIGTLFEQNLAGELTPN
jgi:L-asparaginase